MRNLKKILALVLALMMVLSVMVTASAADFADADKIEYTEAADLMAAIGVVKGNGTGYNPDGLMTRAEAATLLARIALGAEDAALLSSTANSFEDVDVKALDWAAGSIAWTAANKIMDGNGAGKFYPLSKLNGYAWLKMLLNTMGIEGTYTGAGWELNVLNAAREAGLTVIKGFDYAADIARDEAFHIALQALNAGEKVTVYDVALKGDIPATGDIDAAKVVDSYETVLEAVMMANILSNNATNTLYSYKERTYTTDSLLEDVHGVVIVNTVDANGRPGYNYVKRATGAVLSTVLYASDESWANELVSVGDIYDAVTFTKLDEIDVTFVQDSAPWNEPTDDDDSYGYNINNYANVIAGMGSKVDVIVDKVTPHTGDAGYNVDCTVLITNQYVGTVSAVQADNADKKQVAMITLDTGDIYYGTGFAVGDVVVYTKGNVEYFDYAIGLVDEVKGIVSIAEAQLASGKVTAINDSNWGAYAAVVTMAGKNYAYSWTATDFVNEAYTAKTANDVVLILDADGNILSYVDTALLALPDYAVVLNTSLTSNSGATEANPMGKPSTTLWAQMLFADGTIDVVKYYEAKGVAYAAEAAAANAGITLATKDSVVRYVKNPITGVYTLTSTGANIKIAEEKEITQGKPNTVVDGSSCYSTSNATVFAVQSAKPITGELVGNAYTGYANMPTVGAGTKYAVFTNDEVGTVPLVFVWNYKAPAAAGTGKYVYVDADSLTYKSDATGVYYTYAAIVDGKVTTIKVDRSVNVAADMLYSGSNTVSATTGFMTLPSDKTNAGTSGLVVNPTAGTVRIGNNFHTYNADIKVYVDNAPYGISEMTLAEYAASEYNKDQKTDTVWTILDPDTSAVVAIIVAVGK